jgi:glycosyltransferase involved in cell wall biosynthesis
MIFSIIIPIYKTEKYLDECIQSVLSQSFIDYECILIDDGSPDSCPSMCDGYSENDMRVKVIHKENSGPSDSRNVGILQASGSYIVFLDSDDKFTDNNTLRNLFEVIQTYKTDVIINVNNIEFTDTGKVSLLNRYRKDIVITSPDEIPKDFLKVNMYWAGCFFVVKKEYLIKNNLFYKKGILHEDEHWIPRVLFKTKEIAINHYPFYAYRIERDGSTMSKVSVKRLYDLLDITNDLLIWSKEENNYTKEGCAFMKENAKDIYNVVFRLSDTIKYQDKKAYYNIHKIFKNISTRIPENYNGKRLLISKIIGPYNTDLLYRLYINIKMHLAKLTTLGK